MNARCARPRPRRRFGGGRFFVIQAATAVLMAMGPSLGASGTPGSFASEPNATWGTSPSADPADEGTDRAGKVLAVAEVGNRVFIAGEFAGVMPPGTSTNKAREDPTPIVPRRYLAALDVTTGALLDWDAQPDGPVLSLAVSPDGKRLYLGGQFRRVGGRGTARLAAVDVETGMSVPEFTPPEPNAYVKAMALSGDRLFIGGAFSVLGTQSRPQLAAVDAASGALHDDWIPPANTGGHFAGQTGVPVDDGDPGNVADLKVTPDGHRVVVAGSFTDFAGQAGLLVLDAATARPTPWQPTMDKPRPVYGLDIWPGDDDTIFVAAGGHGGVVEAFKPGGGAKPLWVHKVDGDAMDVASTTERLYLVGHYDYVLGDNTTCGANSCTGGNDGDVANRHISAFDPVTGAHDRSFTAQFNTPQGPHTALIGARHLYVGGDFTKVNFAPHPGFVQFPPAAS